MKRRREQSGCRRGPRWPGLAALALALVAIPAAPAPVRAEGHDPADYESVRWGTAGYGRATDWTADYRTGDYGDRARVQWRQEPSTSRKVFDAVILRPLQLGHVVLSAAFFLPAYAVAWPFGVTDDVVELCITEPVDRLFRRPLGEL